MLTTDQEQQVLKQAAASIADPAARQEAETKMLACPRQ